MRKNNKGFSLVELIVVIAIMAILAVTLAPRLTQYVEKSRKAADQEAVNAIYTAARLAVLDEKVTNEFVDSFLSSLSDGLQLGGSTDAALYTVEGKDWKFSDEYPDKDKVLMKEIASVVGEFKLKSAKANDSTEIVLTVTQSSDDLGYDVAVTLSYDGDEVAYTASDAAVRP